MVTLFSNRGIIFHFLTITFVCFLRVLLKGLLIVFLYNYAVHLLYGKSGDGYGFYCLLK